MDRNEGGVKNKVIAGILLLVGVVSITLFATTINNDNGQSTNINEQNSEPNFIKDETGDDKSANDIYRKPKGVSETTETKINQTSNNNQSTNNHRSTPNYSGNQYPNNATTKPNSTSTSSMTTETNNNKPTDTDVDNRDRDESVDTDADSRDKEEALNQQSGHGFSGMIGNTYYFQANCPDEHHTFSTIGGYPVCECTSYVAWKAYEKYDGLILPNWGNAYSWAASAINYGYLVDNNPTKDSIGIINTGSYGSLFWVEQINPDGSIETTQYNNSLATFYNSGEYRSFDYGTLIYPSSAVSQFKYIHLDRRTN